MNRLMIGLVVTALALGIGAATPVAAQGQPEAGVAQQHCVTEVGFTEGGKATPAASQSQCYATFSEAVAAATGGAARLATNASPESVTAAELAPQEARRTVIGVVYWHSRFRGRSHIFYSNVGSCWPGRSFFVRTMPRGWNDEVSSARSYGGCSLAIYYEHVNFGGAQLPCRWACASFGAMNDRTSSIRWFR
jgi:hypothetical protein